MKFSGKKFYLVSIFSLLLSFFFAANFCSAAFLKPGTQADIGEQAAKSAESGYETNNVSDIYALVQTVINAFLSLIGVILLAYLLYAGYKWMTAHGEEKKVDQAKETIQRAITGLIIIVAAYAISIFVMDRLQQGTLREGSTSNPATPVVPTSQQVFPPNTGALDGG